MPLPSLPARMGDSLGPASVRPRTDKDGAGRASAGRVHADQAETPVAKKVVALPIQAKTGNGKESPRLAAVATKTRKKVRLPGRAGHFGDAERRQDERPGPRQIGRAHV